MSTWFDWIKAWHLEKLYGIDTVGKPNDREAKLQPIDVEFIYQPIEITDADRSLAWTLFQQMHTRVVTRTLHPRAGTEKAALTSVYQLFGFSREAINSLGPECVNVATLFNHVLNGRVERFTSKWHRRSEEGAFKSPDECRVFRLELFKLQQDVTGLKDALRQISSKDNPLGMPIVSLPEDSATKNLSSRLQVESKHFVETANAKPLSSLDTDLESLVPNETVQKQGQENGIAGEYLAETQQGWPSTTAEQRKRLLEAIDKDLESKFVPSKIASFKEIETEEKIQIGKRRKANRGDEEKKEGVDTAGNTKAQPGNDGENDQPINNAIGLCFSGGGIRACTFAMGVTQRLAEQGLLKDVDYLSTVSGGGYFGTFLSSYLDTPNPEVGFASNQYPFGKADRTDVEASTKTMPEANGSSTTLVGRDESNSLRHIRNNASYLTWGAWYKFQMFGLIIYGLLVNLLAIFPLVTLAVILTKISMTDAFADFEKQAPDFPYFHGALYWTSVVTLGLGGFLSLIRTFFRGSEKKKLFWWGNHVFGWATRGAFFCFLFVTAVNLLPWLSYLHRWISKWIGERGLSWEFVLGDETGGQTIGSILLAAVAPFILRLLSGTAASNSLISRFFRILFIMSGPLFFLFTYLALVDYFVATPNAETWAVFGWNLPGPTLGIILFGLPLFFGIVMLNINFASPHLFYRNSLCNTFLLRAHDSFHGIADRSAGKADSLKDQGERFDNIDIKLLSQMRNKRPELPYHLINAVVNAPASTEPNLRGRSADFYVFSQCYCGSPLTGYHETEAVEKLDAHLNLGTAMAISGAAASPHSGTLTDKNSVFMLTLLNVRLGYWLRNPAREPWISFSLLNRLRFPRSFYLFIEMFSWVKDKSPWFGWPSAYLNISDGGHLENLGIYELLRRRCKFIIAVDGEADPAMQCSSMMKLVRYARIDFGIDVHFDPKEFANQDSGFAKSHFALGVVDYGKANSDPTDQQRELGIIIYLKNNLTGNESPDVLEYYQRKPDFPHAHIKDQFFDEEQFEAFRSLGHHVADEAMGDDIFDGFVPDDLSVKAWAKELVKKLYQY